MTISTLTVSPADGELLTEEVACFLRVFALPPEDQR
jgi:hypothetical protein